MRVMRAILVGVLAAMTIAPAAAAAEQGTYVVHSCALDGRAISREAWTPAFTGWAPEDVGQLPNPIRESCGSGLGFSVDFSGATPLGPLTASWDFVAPPYTSISSVDLRYDAFGDGPTTGERRFDFRLTAAPGATFNGSVPGAGSPTPRVELQALADGKWAPFKTAALRNGRFKAGYRSLRTFSTQRYSFRAVAYDGPGFPHAAGESSGTKVQVHA
jgi:hypothetical protein